MSTEAPIELTEADKRFYHAFFQRKSPVTTGFLIINVVLFIALVYASPLRVQAFQVGSDSATLINFGAKLNYFVLIQHHWFRLLTPMFLHIGIMHLGINLYSLWQVGPTVERLFGSARYTILYLLAGIGGVVASIVGSLLNNRDSVSAGASGALFGLLGAMLAVSYKYRHELPEGFRRSIGPGMINVIGANLLFGFINNYGSTAGKGGLILQHYIDNWGHIGGLITGFIVGLILPRHQGSETPLPRQEKIILFICGLIVTICFIRAYQLRPFVVARQVQ